ncbi:MAG: ubiquitin, partial [Clostridiaceae bacterium]
MDKINLVDKLRTKANISYEEAKVALENNNWDILDAMVYLE